MTDLIVVLWAVLCLYGVKYCKGKNNFWDDYLSKDNTLILKAIFSLAIVIHHLSQQISPLPKLLLYFFQYVGPWSVMVFFFLSGYNLMYNYIHRDNYEKKFLLKRFINIVPLYIFSIIMYCISRLIFGGDYSLSKVLCSFINGSPVVTHSWYIIVIIVFYIIFYFLMKLFKRNYLMIIIATCLLCYTWIYVTPLINYGWWWSISCFSLPLGMVWATYKNELDSFIKKYYYLLLILFISLFILSFRFSFESSILKFIFKKGDYYRQSILFPITVMLILMKFKFNNKFLKYIGSISLELYLFHGLFSNKILLNFLLNQTNPFLYCFLTFALAILLSSLVHYIFSKINLRRFIE